MASLARAACRLGVSVPRLGVSRQLQQCWARPVSRGRDDSAAPDPADRFGNMPLPLDEKLIYDKFDWEAEDNDEQDKHEATVADIYRPGREHYLRRINFLLHEKQDLVAALDTLETEMKEDCVKPEQAHYRVLIHACAKVGHASKAFELFREFRRRGLRRHVGIYADLFLSCTHCPDRDLALEKAGWLRGHLAQEHFIPNTVLYHTMIQAFGRAGDLETAFALLDEMRKHQVPVTHHTFSFLLQGCLSDRRAGFRHALLAWRAMRRKKVWPRLHNYNLILRAAQWCGLGEGQHTQDILAACLPTVSTKQAVTAGNNSSDNPVPTLVTRGGVPVLEGGGGEAVVATTAEPPAEATSLLAKRPVLGGVVGLVPGRDLPQYRLELLGGPAGLVQTMARDAVKPDVKTFDQLLKLIPSSTQAEQELLGLMEAADVKPDVNFFNHLILMRARRGELELARSTLATMSQQGLSPDIFTFGSLAHCCREPHTVREFLQDYSALGGRLNREIGLVLVSAMSRARHPSMVQLLLARLEREQVTPDTKLIRQVERFHQEYRAAVLEVEAGRQAGRAGWRVEREVTEYKLEHWDQFCKFYRAWLARTRPDLAGEDPAVMLVTKRDTKRRQEQKQRDRKVGERRKPDVNSDR